MAFSGATPLARYNPGQVDADYIPYLVKELFVNMLRLHTLRLQIGALFIMLAIGE